MLREIDDLRNQERLAVAEYAVLKVCVLSVERRIVRFLTHQLCCCVWFLRKSDQLCAEHTHRGRTGTSSWRTFLSFRSQASTAATTVLWTQVQRRTTCMHACARVHTRGACSDFRFINGFEVPESIMRFAHKPKSTACVMASLAVRRLVPALTVLLYVPRDAATQLKGLILKGRKYTQNRAADLVAARK